MGLDAWECNVVDVSLKIPFLGEIKGKWEPNDNERIAAWELYVELVTRISVIELKEDEGLLREALSSLYSIFQTTRDIMRKHGPDVAQPNSKDDYSFGDLALIILNYVLRPVLSKWHPMLLDYESTRDPAVPTVKHEKTWEHNTLLREELNKVRQTLLVYVRYLANVAQIKPIHFTNEPEEAEEA